MLHKENGNVGNPFPQYPVISFNIAYCESFTNYALDPMVLLLLTQVKVRDFSFLTCYSAVCPNVIVCTYYRHIMAHFHKTIPSRDLLSTLPSGIDAPTSTGHLLDLAAYVIKSNTCTRELLYLSMCGSEHRKNKLLMGRIFGRRGLYGLFCY